MIKGIYGGKYMQVNNGSPSWPAIYNNNHYGGQSSGAQGFVGQMRYNTSNQSMEVFDGSMWQSLGTSVSQIGLSPEAERIIDWARQKMDEEMMLKIRMEKHPGLKDAYEKFKIMDALTLEEEETNVGTQP